MILHSRKCSNVWTLPEILCLVNITTIMCAMLHHNSSDTTFWSKIKLHLESITHSPATIMLSSRKLMKVQSNLKKHCEVDKTTIIHAILLHIPNVTTYRPKISFHQKSTTQSPSITIEFSRKRSNVWTFPKIHCEVYKTTIIHAIMLHYLMSLRSCQKSTFIKNHHLKVPQSWFSF
jgi:hypothetical protein